MKMLLWFAVVSILLGTGTASATDYYISPIGNDNNNGTTVATAWQTLAYSAGQLSTGDTLYFIDVGQNWKGEHFNAVNSGTAGNPIKIRAYNGTPTLDGGDINDNGDDHIGIDCDKVKYWDIQGLKIINYNYGIRFRFAEGCSASNNEFGFMNHSSIQIRSSTNCTFEYNDVHDCRWNQISLIGDYKYGVCDNIHIKNNNIYTTAPIFHGCLDLTGYLTNIYIDNNTFVDSPDFPGIYQHQTINTMDGLYIRNNSFSNVLRGIHLDDPAENIVIADNRYWDAPYVEESGFLKSTNDPIENVTLIGNYAWGDVSSGAGYHVYHRFQNSIITGNTVTGFESDDVEYYFWNAYGCVLQNSMVEGKNNYKVKTVGSTVPVEYTDGTVFMIDSVLARHGVSGSFGRVASDTTSTVTVYPMFRVVIK